MTAKPPSKLDQLRALRERTHVGRKAVVVSQTTEFYHAKAETPQTSEKTKVGSRSENRSAPKPRHEKKGEAVRAGLQRVSRGSTTDRNSAADSVPDRAPIRAIGGWDSERIIPRGDARSVKGDVGGELPGGRGIKPPPTGTNYAPDGDCDYCDARRTYIAAANKASRKKRKSKETADG